MRKTTKIAITAVLLIACIVGVSLYLGYNRSASDQIHMLVTTATTHEVEKFTELYFNNYEQLQKMLVPGDTYNGSFTIANHEGATKVYTYEVTVYENGKVTDSSERTVSIAYGSSASLPFSYAAQAKGSSMQVIITLVGLNQEIRMRASS